MTNREAAEAFYAHFVHPGSGYDRMVGALADDVVFDCPFYANLEPRVGKEDVVAMIELVQKGGESYFTEQTFPTHSLVGTDDPELFFIEVTGDHVIRATGKRYRNHNVHQLRIRDGKIAFWREFSNPNVFSEASTPD
jgi:ketosteroid isomerase-like protein